MAAAPVNLYDEVPYPGCAHAQTHPDRLATVATLFGMQPCAVERCRVLELGCGDGANLIPMAVALPQGRFVGIDYSGRAIAKAQEVVDALALHNIVFRCLDLMDASTGLGPFDYIIAHGLYSWVGPALRDKIMEICQAHLAPQGVAFISYNAYPGGHLREMAREMMLFHVRGLADPRERISQARAMIGFLARSECGPEAYQMLLKRQLEQIAGRADSSLYHDDLAETNAPVYFAQFAEHAGRHGLQFLAEADVVDMQEHTFPPHVAEKLRMLADQPVAKEQFRDFLTCRTFRQTLLCRQDVSLERTVKPERLKLFYVASAVRPVSPQPEIRSRSVEAFRWEEARGAKGATMETDHPLAKAALLQLGGVWPQSLHFTDLVERARSGLGIDSSRDQSGMQSGIQDDALLLGEFLLQAYAAGLVELHVRPAGYVPAPGDRPVASPLARWQVRSGNVVTNLRHANVKIEDALALHLLALLDGSRDRPALLRELARLADSDVALASRDGQPVGGDWKTPEVSAPGVSADDLERNLAQTARLALLLA